MKSGDVYPDFSELIKNVLRISGYRCLPYAVKPIFVYNLDILNAYIAKYDFQISTCGQDPQFYASLCSERLSASEDIHSAFRFYHFHGAHNGINLIGEDARTVENGKDIYAALRGDFTLLDEYITQLKELGLFDSTTIIITADHGNANNDTDVYEVADAVTSLMLVKPAGVSDEMPLAHSYAPVGNEDLFATVVFSLGGDGSKYGSVICDIPENSERERLYYLTCVLENGDEFAMREYAVSGDASLKENWHLTGKNWNIKYSEYSFSARGLEEVLDGVEVCEAPEE